MKKIKNLVTVVLALILMLTIGVIVPASTTIPTQNEIIPTYEEPKENRISSDEFIQNRGLETTPSDYFIYSEDNGEINIVGLTDEGLALDVLVYPSLIDGKEVISVSEGVYDGSNASLIVFSDGIKTIQNVTKLAFDNEALVEVFITDSVTEIGDLAFYGCKNLSIVKMPDEIKEISEGCFAFTALTEANIPDSVEVIGSNAYLGCPLEKVYLPANLESMYKNFGDIETLKEVVVNTEHIYVQSNCIYNCPNLETITFTNNVKRIEDNALQTLFDLNGVKKPQFVFEDNPEKGNN